MIKDPIFVSYLKLGLSLVLSNHRTQVNHKTRNIIIIHILGYISTTSSLLVSSVYYDGSSYQLPSISTFYFVYSIFAVLVYTVFPRPLPFPFFLSPLTPTNFKLYIAHPWYIKCR